MSNQITQHTTLAMREIQRVLDAHLEQSESLTTQHTDGALKASEYLQTIMTLDSLAMRKIGALASGKQDWNFQTEIKKGSQQQPGAHSLASTK